MNLAPFLNLPDQDSAAAGFSASGDMKQQSDSGSDTVSTRPAQATPLGGLTPPAAEMPARRVPATGLTGPASTSHGAGAGGGGDWQSSGQNQERQGGQLNYTQGVVKALGGDPYHFRFADGLGARGLSEAHLIPVAAGPRAPAVESTPFELSVNPRAAAAFDALSNINPDMDITGTLALIRDTNDLGAYLKQREAEDAVRKAKESISRLMIRPPTEAQLGMLPQYVTNAQGVAVPVYDPHEMLDKYRGALRMATLDRQGTIDLDYENWKIKTIGKSRLPPEQFVQAVRDRYKQGFTEGIARGNQIIKSRGYIYNLEMPLELQLGNFADRYAQGQLRDFSEAEGVQEGPGQILALGRWAYYKDTSGLHAQPDVLIDPGVERGHILDGKATRFELLSPSMRRQLEGYHDLGVPTVEATTQHGHILVPPRSPEKNRSRK